ncbi:SUMO-activating enzyme subunit 2, putative [Plasmodium knowlesi strain H]|uniref:SUMO-activating enzyme subunit n=3 Tax=Plasmodium knowlesi TaxID=5850 RepID=A0A5K1VNS5_PLAKH|nr:SUMO-activating enzyme subunit 2, putative [Plasmodium knowlesi strain H]OTN63750.1 putative SUMO-activating enzyme subunit 2 [Plasmodium knowlesi]CAA9991164.1 SUMO-activating enzyme subunit 2, putative [Plasmodium knowlesi strain H]SBO27135.1 SUMO-activating enzyme subunit 2, putative [Plasmodium knowlesi strain H]SBO29371.1 SUMO-activating enzyme subunit 2, putative [Plasmodium knowlesi strain H]VVS80638.1 SUMO-activating enzyme subunit 2, putative [Plasmodium knowlesi strain H]|eukprot:XP_002262456.1 Ubiquitin activating enzyme, putative [Plasmodium knowlesi strain H]
MHRTLRKIFDRQTCDKIESMKILLVGAGGIGSEFLKNIITIGCRNIDIVDIDTIDITNLNRQFLFKKDDVKKYKSFVAKQRALQHKKDLNINAYTFDVCTMKGSDIAKYDYVVNALDNIKARKYVNKLCVMEKKVLIEAGSTGYNGQVYPILANETKCYNCEEKPKNKTYAICTIRQTPSLPEHCVAWGRLIFETFFCKSDNETLIDIKNHIEEESKKRNMEQYEIITFIFNYLFYDTIKELATLKKDYGTEPIPILFKDNAKKEDKCDEMEKEESNTLKEGEPPHGGGQNEAHKHKETEPASITLCSQNIWKQDECIKMYTEAFEKLYSYLNINKKTEEYLVFDKDDDDCINFITAISNLRMMNFSIKQKSKFDVQSIAGNIIPAISSTNAIVASLQASQLIHVIEHLERVKGGDEAVEKISLRDSKAKHVWVKSIVSGNKMFSRGNIVNAENLEAPNPRCYICQQPMIDIYIKSFSEMTLYDFVKNVCTNELAFLYPFLDKQDRNIFDYDSFLEEDEEYIKSLYNSLSEWDIKNDEILILTDFQNDKDQLEIHLKEDPTLEVPYDIKQKVVKKTKADELNGPEAPPPSSKKRKHINEEEEPLNDKKKARTQNKVEEIVIDDEECVNDSLVLID